ncbi:hypothetical protein Holit_02721 [Hollandina sp. SP2]
MVEEEGELPSLVRVQAVVIRLAAVLVVVEVVAAFLLKLPVS